MSRPRTNDPLGVSDNPDVVEDPDRVDSILKEFQRKLAYIKQSYQVALNCIGSDTDYNASLQLLKQAVDGKRSGAELPARLHWEVELVVSHFAKKEAALRSGEPDAEVTQDDIERGAQLASETLASRAHRPVAAGRLQHHVEGLMALCQETSGRPVMAQRSKNSTYEPQLTGSSVFFLDFFKSLHPDITETQLVTIICHARRKYAGKPMRFADFFPGYGVSVDEMLQGALLGNGMRIEALEVNTPTYCP